MAKLPMNVVNFAAQTNADNALVYEIKKFFLNLANIPRYRYSKVM